MVFEVVTAADGAEVLRRAKTFFAERVPMYAAFPEKEGPTWLTLRGQGGEEIALRGGAGAGRHQGPGQHAAVRSAGGPLPVDPSSAAGGAA